MHQACSGPLSLVLLTNWPTLVTPDSRNTAIMNCPSAMVGQIKSAETQTGILVCEKNVWRDQRAPVTANDHEVDQPGGRVSSRTWVQRTNTKLLLAEFRSWWAMIDIFVFALWWKSTAPLLKGWCMLSWTFCTTELKRNMRSCSVAHSQPTAVASTCGKIKSIVFVLMCCLRKQNHQSNQVTIKSRNTRQIWSHDTATEELQTSIYIKWSTWRFGWRRLVIMAKAKIRASFMSSAVLWTHQNPTSHVCYC